MKNRLLLTVPLLAAGAFICRLDYSVVWRYFSWANQTLAMITLWAASVYLCQQKKNEWITVIPAVFMTAVSAAYFVTAPECLGLLWNAVGVSFDVYYPVGVGAGILFGLGTALLFLKRKNSEPMRV